MKTIEIVLIIIGLLFLLVSFFIKDVLSRKDIDKIAELSEKELQEIIDKQLEKADDKIEESIDLAIDVSEEKTKRELEKTTNEKIMAISEFSDTVLDSMNKTHNEIMFLYSMLNDKHGELTELAGDLQGFSSRMKDSENEIMERLAEASKEMEEKVRSIEMITEEDIAKTLEEADSDDKTGKSTKNSGTAKRTNNEILSLHAQGMSDVEIAKELGRGLGEVKLVLGLYQGVTDGEV